MEDKKKLTIVGVVALVAAVTAAATVVYRSSSAGETHRDLKEVPPKGAGKYRDVEGMK